MIDLHLHTTASDGSSSPAALVAEAAAAGIDILAVTDHDTVAAVGRVRAEAWAASRTAIPGIEITAVLASRDVHVLGYFFDPDDADLARFLERQRSDRRRRVTEMAERLAILGVPIDGEALLRSVRPGSGQSLGRPSVARALVAAGHAHDIADAFDRYLGSGRPGFIERRGATPIEVVEIIARAGGVSSLAHPGKTGVDDIIPELAAHGLSALEVFHPDHSADDVGRYGALASTLGLLVTGGSDYHGKDNVRRVHLGAIGVTHEMYERLVQAASSRA